MGPTLLLTVALVLTTPSPSGFSSSQVKGSSWTWHSARYKKSRDYRSLRVLIRRLKIGMPRSKVEEILGEPDYSPVEGQYYYSSDRENAKGVTIGLVVEYRKTEYRDSDIHTVLTGKLESFRLMAIGE